MGVQTVSVMFTDLVDSTATMYRLGEAAADELRREHDEILRGEIEANDGRVVKHLGDGMMAVFVGAVAALEGAAMIQQRLSGRPVTSEPLRLRIGVSSGEAAEDGDDYFGVPVVEAARLCASADPGEIRLTEMVRMLVRSRGHFELESLGELDLKGLSGPLAAYRLRWEPIRTASVLPVALPRTVEQFGAVVVAGRHHEREVLDQALKAAEAGDRRAVLISGEPGIGKTTLAAAFARAASADGVAVSYGRCDLDLQAPYKPWVEVIEHVLGHLPEDVIAAHVAECGDHVGRLAPGLLRAPGSAGPSADGNSELDRYRLFRSVADLLMRAAACHVTVLLLDDLHWADRESLQLLKYLLSTDRPQRMMVVGTFCTSGTGSDTPLGDVLASLHREPGVQRIVLEGLGDDDLLWWLEELAGHGMDDDGLALRNALTAETDGNPFFVGELLRHLRDTGAIRPDDEIGGRWMTMTDVLSAGLPVSIREVVTRRVRWLGPEMHGALSAAAVVGRTFDVDVLARVLSVDVSRIIELCEQAVAADILDTVDLVDGYQFAHALIERTLYDELSGWQRAAMHQEVAEAIESIHGEARVGELAYHWAQATRPKDTLRAVRYAQAAGDIALQRLAPSEARRWYSDAFGLLDDAEGEGRLGVELRLCCGLACRALGDPGAQDQLLDSARAAIALGDRDLVVRAALAAARTRFIDVDDDLIEVLRVAIEAVGSEPTAERAQLLSCLAAELTYAEDPTNRRELATEAVAIARAVHDARIMVDVGTKCDFALDDHRLVEQHRSLVEEVAGLADNLGEPDLILRAHSVACRAVLRSGDRDAYEHHRGRVRDALSRLGGWPGWQASGEYAELFGPVLDGEPDAVDAAYGAYLDAATEVGNERIGRIVFSAGMLTSAWMRGALGPLVPIIEQNLSDNPQMTVFRSVLAWAHGLERATGAVVPLLEEAREGGFDETGPEFRLFAQALWAEASHAVRDRESAAILAPRLERWADQMALNAGAVFCSVSHYAGLARHTLGDLDLAARHLENASAAHRALRARFLAACSHVALAEVLSDRGSPNDLVRASELAAEVLVVAHQHGYGYVHRSARELQR